MSLVETLKKKFGEYAVIHKAENGEAIIIGILNATDAEDLVTMYSFLLQIKLDSEEGEDFRHTLCRIINKILLNMLPTEENLKQQKPKKIKTLRFSVY